MHLARDDGFVPPNRSDCNHLRLEARITLPGTLCTIHDGQRIRRDIRDVLGQGLARHLVKELSKE